MSDRKQIWRDIFLIFSLSLSVRFLYLAERSSSEFFHHFVVDDKDYFQRALGLLDGTWPDHHVYAQAPGYPYLLALLFYLTSPSIPVARAAQAVIGALTSAGTYGLGRLLFDRKAGLIAGMLAAFHGTLLFFDGEGLPVTPEIFFDTVMLGVLFLAEKRSERGLWWLAGLLGGLSAITRGTVLLVLPFIALWILFSSGKRDTHAEGSEVGSHPSHRRPSFRGRLPALLLFLTGMALPIVPVAVHNFFAEEIPQVCFSNAELDVAAAPKVPLSLRLKRALTLDFSLIACNAGCNLVLGTHRDYRDRNRFEYPRYWSRFRELMERPYKQGIVRPVDQSRFHTEMALEDVRQAPWEMLNVLGKRVLQLINGEEIPRNMHIYPVRAESNLLRVLLWSSGIAFPNGLLIPLGLVGLALFGLSNRNHRLVLVFTLIHLLFVLFFFVTARYRAPVTPIFLIYAVSASRYLFRQGLKGERRALVALAALVPLFILSNRHLKPMEKVQPAYAWINLGDQLSREGKRDAARHAYQEALRQDNRYTSAYLGLADLERKAGNIDAAIHWYKKALALDPHDMEVESSDEMHARIYNALGELAAGMGKLEDAREAFTKAVALAPAVAQLHANLGAILEARGETHRALQEYGKALDLDPALVQVKRRESELRSDLERRE